MVKQLKFDMPDIVLVRKVEQDFLIVVLIVVQFYMRREDRHWTLRQLDYDEDQAAAAGSGKLSKGDEEAQENDYEEFLQQVETDKDMRSQINLYRDKGRAAEHNESHVVADDEYVQLEELLDDMGVNDRHNRYAALDDDAMDEKEDDGFDVSAFVPSDFKFL